MTPRYTRKAEDDLADIHAYSAEMWGAAQAARYLDALSDTIDLLATMPSMGRKCDTIFPGHRRFEQAKHVIFYKIVGSELVVARILHARRLPLKQYFIEL